MISTPQENQTSGGAVPQAPARGTLPSAAELDPVRTVAKALLPPGVRAWVRRTAMVPSVWPPRALVRWGSLRRLLPVSRRFGVDRGRPVDRYYIERFLSNHAADVHGHVLEIGDDRYTRRFGDRVTHSDVLDAGDDNPKATIVADLADAPHIASETFDCIICTQTLLLIYDVEAAIKTLARILKPGGVLLVTLPGISQICRREMDRWGDFWRFTSLSAQRLFEEAFGTANVCTESHGNVLTAVAFLEGLAVEDLRTRELDYRDPNYEVTIAVRATKPRQQG